jgi:L,D-peptidoglycan transpeptidase YkuD (ErfK/YbiS/YcfS/YnhG family)
MRLEAGFFRRDRLTPPPSPLPLQPIRCDMGWCDAPRHPLYNRLVRLPFEASHEKLQREDGLYDVCLVLDWNRTPRRRNRGSAIFLHIARPGYPPTEGCVAVNLPAMRLLLAHVRPGTSVLVL